MGRVVDGATQPDVDAVPLFAANCRKTSLLTGSAGLDSNERAKRATWLPIHLVCGAGAGHEKDRTTSEISRVQCPLLYKMPRGSPEVATLSNTIDNGLKQTDFRN